jgi:hypothetical protein
LSHTINFLTESQSDSSSTICNIFVDYVRLSSSYTFPIINDLLQLIILLQHLILYLLSRVPEKWTMKLMQFQFVLKNETLLSLCTYNDNINKFNSFPVTKACYIKCCKVLIKLWKRLKDSNTVDLQQNLVRK